MATSRHGKSRPGMKEPSRAQRHAVREHPERQLRRLRSSRGVARNVLARGAIVLARVPFAERHESKLRPAVVVGLDGEHVVVRPMTTSWTTARRAGAVEVVWRQRRCWVLDRLIRLPLLNIVTLEQPGAA